MTLYWLHTPTVHALGWTLVHSLWQAGLVALFVRLLWAPVSQQWARWRYNVGLGALLAILAGAVFTYMHYYRIYDQALDWTLANALLSAEAETAGVLTGQVPFPESELAPSFLENVLNAVEGILPGLVLAWLLGTLLLGFRLAGGWLGLRRLSRRGVAEPPAEWAERFARLTGRMGVRREVVLRFSRLATAPMTLRHLKPVILFPVGLINQLTVEQAEAILLHELAHIRRWDYLVNWLQSILELLFFYHPAVWWLSGQVREAREHCCDDLVIRLGGASRMGYAQALTHLTAISITERSSSDRWTERTKTKLAMSATGINGAFTQRIKRLFGHYETTSDWRKPVLSAFIGLAVLSGLAWVDQPVDRPAALERETAAAELTDSFELVPFIRVNDLELAFSKPSAPFTLLTLSRGNDAGGAGSQWSFTGDELTYNENNKEVRLAARSLVLKLKRPLGELSVNDVSWGQNVRRLEQINAESLETLIWNEERHALRVYTTGQTPAGLTSGSATGQFTGAAVASDTVPRPEKQPETKSSLPAQEAMGDGRIQIKASEANQQPLILIDGQNMGRDQEKLQQIDPSDITHVNVLKGESAMQQYGPEGKDGVIEISTKRGAVKGVEIPKQPTPPNTTISIRPPENQEPLIIIDGQNMGRGQAKIQQIDPADISHINVLKGEKAIQQYGSEGKEGVIEVFTKGGAQKTERPGLSPRKVKPETTAPEEGPLKLKAKPIEPAPAPLIILDGEVIGRRDKSFFNQLDPNTIDRVNVIKTVDAVQRYGPEAENGVVEIFTKKDETPPQATPLPLTSEKEKPAAGSAFQEQLEASVQVYPTPFSDEVQIVFTLPRRAAVKVSIFTLDGRLVKTLLNDTLTAGEHQLPWAPGQKEAGSYLVRIEAGEETVSRKIIRQ